MQNFRVYSQRVVNSNGIETKTGEDAFPFVNNNGMFVADGMGGSAGIAITSVDPRCFDTRDLSEMVCEEFNLERGTKEYEEMETYLTKHFSSLANSSMKELYQDPTKNVFRLKKSGYFGSHALGTALAYRLMELEKETKEAEISAEEWKKKVFQIRDGLFEDYKKSVNMLGAKPASVMFNSKVYYYATTLSAVFYRETEESVDVIFLNSGDSRICVWDEQGFRQACDDQGRDGGMTSFISLGEDANHLGENDKPTIFCEVRSYKKPCALFCMTDGIYASFVGKDGFHSSPLYMEMRLMDAIKKGTSMEDIENRLTLLFDKIGGIDDSNSMVVSVFGYDDFEAFRLAAEKRYKWIEEEYELQELTSLDFFLKDLEEVVKRDRERKAEGIRSLLGDVYNIDEVRWYCQNKIRGAQRFLIKEEEIKKLQVDMRDIREALLCVVKDNCLDFHSEIGICKEEKTTYFYKVINLLSDKEEQKKRDARKAGDAYVEILSSRSKLLENIRMYVMGLSDSIVEYTHDIDVASEDPITEKILDDVERVVPRAKDKIEGLSSELLSAWEAVRQYTKKLYNSRKDWIRYNRELLEIYIERGEQELDQKINAIVDQWIAISTEEEEKIEELVRETTFPSVKRGIINLLKRYKKKLEEITQKENELLQERNEAAVKYWEDNQVKDIYSLLRNDKYFKGHEALREEIKKHLEAESEKNEELMWAEKQMMVFALYLERYLVDCSEDKIEDVRKNGWL